MNVPTNELVEQIKNNMGLVFVIRVDPGELRSDEKNSCKIPVQSVS